MSEAQDINEAGPSGTGLPVGKYYFDWCDIADDDVLLGLLQVWPQDGYWRFTPLPDRPLTCGHARRIAEMLSELNKEKTPNGQGEPGGTL